MKSCISSSSCMSEDDMSSNPELAITSQTHPNLLPARYLPLSHDGYGVGVDFQVLDLLFEIIGRHRRSRCLSHVAEAIGSRYFRQFRPDDDVFQLLGIG